MVEGYSGWMTREMMANPEIVAERLRQEAHCLEFVGKSPHYENGKILINGSPVFGADLIGNWSRSFEYPYVSLNIPRDKRLSVLDVGSGYSYFPFYVKSFGHIVTCCDLLDLSLLYENTGLHFMVDDITASRNGNTYDVVYCISVLEHLVDKKAAVNKMYDMLNVGGRLILTLDCDLYDGKQGDTPNYSSVAQLVCLLNEKFKKNINDFNLSRTNLLTSVDFLGEKWRLPWRYQPQTGQTFFERIQAFFQVAYHRNTTPCLGVFVATWVKC